MTRVVTIACVGLWVALVAGCGEQVMLRGSPPPAPTKVDRFVYEPIRDQPACSVPVAPEPVAPAAREMPVPPPVAEAGWEPTVPERGWRYIVVHHSATANGNAAIFDRWHRNGRHWDELGYHFVIGNGTDSPNGKIEIGPRWFKQKHGAHCRVGDDETYNQTGIGICLVGDFEKARPSEAQMDALARLIDWLTQRFQVPDQNIIGHCFVDDTKCPGRYFSFTDLKRRLDALRAGRSSLAHAGR